MAKISERDKKDGSTNKRMGNVQNREDNNWKKLTIQVADKLTADGFTPEQANGVIIFIAKKGGKNE